MIKKILKTISIGVIMSFVVTALPLPAFAAGTPHTSYGIVSGGQTSDSWTLYVVARPSEVLTNTLSEAGGSYFYQAPVGNLSTPWAAGDDSLVFIARETNPGANNHAGYYAVMNEDLSVTENPQAYNECTVREIPVPTATAGSGNVGLSWTAAATDTSETPPASSNVASYRVYRGTSQSSLTFLSNASGTSFTDSTGTAGTTYYYAIEPVFRGAVALGVYSANSNAVEYPDAPTQATITRSPTTFTLSVVEGTNHENRTFTVGNSGSASLNYTVSDNQSWLSVNPTSGTIASGGAAVTHTVTFSTSGLSAGTHNANITITDINASNNPQTVAVNLTVTPPDAPTVTGITPNSGEQGETLDITISGTDTSWTGGETVSFDPADGITINSVDATNGTTLVVNIDIAAAAAATARTVTVSDTAGSATFTVTESAGDDAPVVSGISVATAEAGQTIVITGTGFGDYVDGTSVVRFGTTVAYPASWEDGLITVCVPTGLPTGEIDVTVVNAGGENSEPINISGNIIYIDDMEGGCVGNWTAPAATSGYYEFDKYDATHNPDVLSTSYPDRELDTTMVHDGNQSMKLLYSYGNRRGDDYAAAEADDWGGGWGAALINTLDLSDAEAIRFLINWDGSANEIKITLKDSDGSEVAGTVSNTALMSLTGYGRISIAKANFDPDVDGTIIGFDWSKVVGYNVVYTLKNTSTNSHYIDTIYALRTGMSDPFDGDDDDDDFGLHIEEIDPAVGPAGTRILITGESFGATQGLSKLHFEKTEARTVYEAEIVSWSDASLEVIVPRTAAAGNYTVKVIKMTVAAAADGITTVQESNPEAFKVTASAANEGGLATIYPNPFNPLASGIGVGMHASGMQAATVAFNPGSATNIGIYIYDMTAKLVYRKMVTSTSQISWDGRDDAGRMLGDGVYILRITDEDSKRLIAKGKILIVKQ